MTPNEFYQLGIRLGTGWQTKLARHLKCNDRTVRRYLSGEREIRPPVEEKIRAIVQEHGV